MRHGDWAWLVLAGGVCAYEAYAGLRQRELLSCAMDRYIDAHPLITRATVAAVSLHISNIIPEKFDVVHVAFLGVGRARKWCQKNSGGLSSDLKATTR